MSLLLLSTWCLTHWIPSVRATEAGSAPLMNLHLLQIVKCSCYCLGPSPLVKGSREGDAPVCLDTWVSTVESSCLVLQLKAGGKFHQWLNIGGKPIAYKYHEGKMQRTLKRELKSTWNCWKGSEGNQCHPRHTSLLACGKGAVAELARLGWECRIGARGVDSGLADDTHNWGWRNGFLYPVLKHGPRSLTNVRVQGWQTPVCNESDSGWTTVTRWHNPPVSIPRENGLSVSIHVGTRKMVNYAWIG